MAIVQNLTIDQGSSFAAEVTIYTELKAFFDLTNYTASGQIRKAPTSANASATFLCQILSPTGGKINFSLTDEQTAALKPGRYMYDIVISNNSGEKFRAVEGIVTVMPSITR